MESFVYGLLFLTIISLGFLIIYGLLWLTGSFRKVTTFVIFWVMGSGIGVIMGVLIFAGILRWISELVDFHYDKVFFIYTVTFGFSIAAIYQSLSSWKDFFERTKYPFLGLGGSSSIDFGSVFEKRKDSTQQTDASHSSSKPDRSGSSKEGMEGKGGQSGGGGATGDW